MSLTKLRAAQCEECVDKLDWYDKSLRIIIANLEIAKKLSSYNKLPRDFVINQKKSIEVITNDIKSMLAETAELALLKAEKASDLRLETQTPKEKK